jgi:hypothetical protein
MATKYREESGLSIDQIRSIKLRAYQEVLKDLSWQQANLSKLANQTKAVQLSINQLLKRINWVSSSDFNIADEDGHRDDHEDKRPSSNTYSVPSGFGSRGDYEITEREL